LRPIIVVGLPTKYGGRKTSVAVCRPL